MYNDVSLFVELHNLVKPQDITLGDEHVVQVTGRGAVITEIESPKSQKVKKCILKDVLYVPILSYNLLSVSKATKSGKTVKFVEDGCHILHENQKPIATAIRVGKMYYLNCVRAHPRRESKEVILHKRYGHLGVQYLQKLTKDNLVDCYNRFRFL